MSGTSSLNAAMARDRWIVIGAMLLMAALAWAYTVHLALMMESQDMIASMAQPMSHAWSATDFLMMFVMWAVMMVAMMLPAVTPMVLVFAGVQRKRREQGRPFTATGVFVFGYLLMWAAFSLLATGVNWLLHSQGQLTAMMGRTTPLIAGGMLVAAGAFQWTSMKQKCLKHCRSPLVHLMAHWREGTSGALWMGMHHGVYCLGCCWLLMALLFVLGVMNLVWIAVLTAFVLLEKVLPSGRWITRLSGVLLIAWGLWLIVAA